MLELIFRGTDSLRDQGGWSGGWRRRRSASPFRGIGHRRRVRSLRLAPARSVVKRIFDFVGAGLLLVALAPTMLVVAFIVRMDGGPALFRHSRLGARGRPFGCLKFRTMHIDAEARLRELLERDPIARAEWERDFKLRNDPRVTRLGGFLRRTSLDELPQLLNVLRGEMSLVGPRPIVRAEVARYGTAMHEYIRCRPGITGLWQVSGRNDVDYQTRVELDCRYVRTWQLGQDVSILLRTVGVVLRRSGAY